MKAKNYFLTALLLLFTGLIVFGQSGMTIKSGGAVTVNGNLNITATSFICGNPLTDARDGKTYNTVLIGTQCWFKENLNVGTKVIGSVNQTNNGIIEKYCFNDDENNCNTYGGLYQWDEAMQYVTTEGAQGICPVGWHLPNDAEWTTLTDYLGGLSVAGGKMKETGAIHWLAPNTGATNSSAFTALPSGFSSINTGFNDFAGYAYFWSSSQHDKDYPWYRILLFNYEGAYQAYNFKEGGYSIRCLKE